MNETYTFSQNGVCENPHTNCYHTLGYEVDVLTAYSERLQRWLAGYRFKWGDGGYALQDPKRCAPRRVRPRPQGVQVKRRKHSYHRQTPRCVHWHLRPAPQQIAPCPPSASSPHYWGGISNHQGALPHERCLRLPQPCKAHQRTLRNDRLHKR